MLLLGAACAWWVDRPAVAVPGARPGIIRRWCSLCGLPVLVPAFVALARLQVASRGFARGPQIVLWLVLLVIAADVGAYFAGRSLGRRKLAPRVSPGKTVEGALGGLLLVALVAWGGAAHFGLPPLDRGGIRLRRGHFFHHRRSDREHVQARRGAQGQRRAAARTRRAAGSHRQRDGGGALVCARAVRLRSDRMSAPAASPSWAPRAASDAARSSVVALHPERFRVAVLAAHGSWEAIVEQARQFRRGDGGARGPQGGGAGPRRRCAPAVRRPAWRAAPRRWPKPSPPTMSTW